MEKLSKAKGESASQYQLSPGAMQPVTTYWGYIPWKDKLDEVLPQLLDQALKRLRGSNYDAMTYTESDEVRVRALCAMFNEANVEEQLAILTWLRKLLSNVGDEGDHSLRRIIEQTDIRKVVLGVLHSRSPVFLIQNNQQDMHP